MTTICPKCAHARQPDAAVPAWQCPSCGIAYAKASAAAAPATPAAAARIVGRESQGLPWRTIGLIAAIVVGIFWGRQAHWDLRGPGAGEMDDAAIRTLAASVQAEQVVMYSTTECGYCAQAKSWLTSYGFAFTECNTTVDSRCQAEFQALRGIGVPYLVVRGPRGEHHMKEGFDSDEFLAALRG